MTAPNLSSEAQLRYMLQWFEEWSELQRQDFVPILASKLATAHFVNGVVSALSGLNCQDKPMSLFQCRIKLFNEWYPTWSEEERSRLVTGVTEMDGDFGTKVQEELAAMSEPKVNGDVNGIDEELDNDVEVVAENHEHVIVNGVAVIEEILQNGEAHDVDINDGINDGLPENQMPLEIVATS